MSKPSNWHSMSNAERKAWTDADNERYDLERAAEDSARAVRQAERDLKARQHEQQVERDEHAEAVAYYEGELSDHLCVIKSQSDIIDALRDSLADLIEASGLTEAWLRREPEPDRLALADDLKESLDHARKLLTPLQES